MKAIVACMAMLLGGIGLIPCATASDNDSSLVPYTTPSTKLDSKLFDISITEINPAWCSASIFPGTPAKGAYSISGMFYHFTNLNISVGTYTTCDQMQGTFLLALEMSQSGIRQPGMRVVKEFNQPIKPTLMEFQGGFLLFECDQCKEASLFTISGYPYKFIAKDRLDEKQIADGTEAPLFVDCQKIFRKEGEEDAHQEINQGGSTSQLKPIYPPDVFPEDKCFKATPTELFVSSSNIGLVSLNLENEESIGLLSDSHIEREITGESNKRYVLIRSGYARGGTAAETYYIFHLSSDNSYQLKELLSSLEDPVGGVCGRWSESGSGVYQLHSRASSIDNFRILNDGTTALKISFEVTEQDCKTLKKRRFAKTLNVGDESFKASEEILIK